MKRKDYQTPTMKIVQLKQRSHILAGSPYETTGSEGTSINAMGEETDL